MGKEITSLAVHNESVFAAAGDFVGRYVRGKEVGRFVVSQFDSPVDGYESDSSTASSSSSSSAASSSSSSSSSDSDSESGDPSLSGPDSLSSLLLFGNTLVALSASGRRTYVWDVPPYVKPASKDPAAADADAAETEEAEESEEEGDESVQTPYATLEFPVGFTATKAVHPASYLNKVVVGSKEGELAVWNVRTGCVFPAFPFSLSV
jgi:U3 small nucleolar RNA-associated protein 21